MNTNKYAYSMIGVLCVWLYVTLTIDYNDLLDIPMGVYALILAVLIFGTHFLAVRMFGKQGGEPTNKQIVQVFVATIAGLVLAAVLSYVTSMLLGN